MSFADTKGYLDLQMSCRNFLNMVVYQNNSAKIGHQADMSYYCKISNISAPNRKT